MSDTKPENDSDNEDDRILNAFTATINPTNGIIENVDEEEEMVESKFKKMDNQDDIHTAYDKLYKLSEKHEKLYRLTIKKLSDVELDCEELSTKFDLEHYGLRIISWLRRPRSLKWRCFKLELNWGGLQVQSLMRCSIFRNLLLIEQV